ncbi:tyrosine-type recombinase/integrase [Streptomyces sp. NPDC091368]|uniref:tyrosine-type recombinase/integrase n=1 Tax=Streptomyces sp. NPDC091368 TaxID=3365993 RepID=UPI0037FBCC0B
MAAHGGRPLPRHGVDARAGRRFPDHVAEDRLFPLWHLITSRGQRFRRLAKDVALPPIRLHDLRHETATLALTAGTDLRGVQETLGHSTITLAADACTSLVPALSRAAAVAVVSRANRRLGLRMIESAARRWPVTVPLTLLRHRVPGEFSAPRQFTHNRTWKTTAALGSDPSDPRAAAIRAMWCVRVTSACRAHAAGRPQVHRGCGQRKADPSCVHDAVVGRVGLEPTSVTRLTCDDAKRSDKSIRLHPAASPFNPAQSGAVRRSPHHFFCVPRSSCTGGVWEDSA